MVHFPFPSHERERRWYRRGQRQTCSTRSQFEMSGAWEGSSARRWSRGARPKQRQISRFLSLLGPLALLAFGRDSTLICRAPTSTVWCAGLRLYGWEQVFGPHPTSITVLLFPRSLANAPSLCLGRRVCIRGSANRISSENLGPKPESGCGEPAAG